MILEQVLGEGQFGDVYKGIYRKEVSSNLPVNLPHKKIVLVWRKVKTGKQCLYGPTSIRKVDVKFSNYLVNYAMSYIEYRV